MAAHLVGRLALAALGLAIFAPAPAAHAQAHPKTQLEVSLDHTGSASMSGFVAEGPTGGLDVRQQEAVRYSVGASRLVRIAPRTSLRIGLLLSNKGFTERATTVSGTTDREIDFLYVGAPVALGYNLVNPRRGLKPFAEVGVIPELLARDEDAEYFDPDLKDMGLSYLFSVGVKYDLGDGRALVLAPELRLAAGDYSRGGVNRVDFRPSTGALKLAVQF